MHKRDQKRQSGRDTLEQTIVKMLKKAPRNMLAISDLKKKLGVKRFAYQAGKYYPSHFYKTIKNLEDEGKVKLISIRAQGKIMFEAWVVLVKELPASFDEIKPFLDNLKNRNEVVRKNAAEDFLQLSSTKKVYITPEISKVLKKVLSEESYEDIRDRILEGLLSILETVKNGDDTSTIDKIKENFLDILIKIASNNSADTRDRIRAIKLLGKIDGNDVLGPIFSIIANEDEKIFLRKLGGPLIDALNLLRPNFEDEIRGRLYRLLKNKKTQWRANFMLSGLRPRLVASDMHKDSEVIKSR